MKYLFPLLILLLLTGCARPPEPIADSAPDGFCAIHPLGDGVAAVREEADGISVTVLNADLTPSQAVLCEGAFLSDCEITPQEDSLWIADVSEGMGWRISENLQVSAVTLPPGYRRGIWQGTTLYYTTDEAVRAWECSMVRLIKQMPCKDVSLFLWSNSELALSTLAETTIISTANGMELDCFPGRLLSSMGKTAVFQDGAGQCLLVREEVTPILTALPGKVLSCTDSGLALIQEEANLSVADVQSDSLCACTDVPVDLRGAVVTPDAAILLDSEGNLESIPVSQWRTECHPLSRDEFATMKKTCTERLRILAQRASDMSERYAVSITIDPSPYGLTAECQPQRLARALDGLDTVLPLFPQEIFPEEMKIAIVPANDNPESDAGGFVLHHGDGEIIAIAAGTGREAYAFLHNFSHLMDGEVIAACAAFDNWETCNPANFGYGLPGNDERAEYAGFFPSEKAMESPREDRAEIFAAACMPGRSETFRTEAMQRKLLRLCTGIRKVCHLEQDTRIFRWEQYLYKTLAPPRRNA